MTATTPVPGADVVRVGALIPTSEPLVLDSASPVVAPRTWRRRADVLGFDSLWAGESMQHRRLDPLPVVAGAAEDTTVATLGTAALIPAHRQPVDLARRLATLDDLSEGRSTVGIGVGFPSRSTRGRATPTGTTTGSPTPDGPRTATARGRGS
jgi:alkanesulfonate monooxygenase SsuD/methylene tetrahydromethanopterin reductase-like flavin-dependent oxidoreductase (luciferase family)